MEKMSRFISIVPTIPTNSSLNNENIVLDKIIQDFDVLDVIENLIIIILINLLYKIINQQLSKKSQMSNLIYCLFLKNTIHIFYFRQLN